MNENETSYKRKHVNFQNAICGNLRNLRETIGAFVNYIILIILLLNLYSCHKNESDQTLFTLMPSKKTGIDFANNLDFSKEFNIYTYRNFYNGGGVAIIDVNNDNLMDIYFTANMQENKLYLNKGNFQFEDITTRAGVAGTKAWSTGVSAVDVNADGFMDLYVCNSGDVAGDDKSNELFINNGDNTFTERAAEYGLADQGLSTHGIFFDYDRDGDLDMYLLNNSYQAITSFNLQENQRPVRDKVGGDKLFRNDDGKFNDVSEEAGIYGSVIGFGLGASVGDVDGDGWLDIYVSNDFFERDYLYMNNGDGTFTENLEEAMPSISNASMGADMADLTGDGFPEIFVTEMLPDTNERIKTKTTFESWDKSQFAGEHGYHNQFTRNMLQLNNGDGTFSDIGRLTGVDATDWSWAALIADFDLDGRNDIFVANGLYQDITDRDYVDYASSQEVKKAMITEEGVDFKKLIDIIPSEKLSNYMFQNTSSFGRVTSPRNVGGMSARGGQGGAQPDISFKNVAKDWGLAKPSHSNGSAYADLDNDGDLDLVVNNTNMEAFVYRNNVKELDTSKLSYRIQIVGPNTNTNGVGAEVYFANRNLHSMYEVIDRVMINKGFQSSSDPRLIFTHPTLKNYLKQGYVKFADTSAVYIDTLFADSLYIINYADAVDFIPPPPDIPHIHQSTNLPFYHKENPHSDFDQERLIYHMLSTEGPAMAIGDLNGDGIEDAYFGGAKDQSGQLLFGNKNGSFSEANSAVFEQDKTSEDVDALFFDADGDKDLDLYVVSGGSEFSPQAPALADRLYINNGQGLFIKTQQVLPAGFEFSSGSTVAVNDYDNDGDMDLFVGSRSIPRLYGAPPNSFLLENDGKGQFSVLQKFEQFGMVTDAIWANIDQDPENELIVVGEWMNVTIGDKVGSELKFSEIENTAGWWNAIAAADIDGDGDIDMVGGNHGLNSRFRCAKDQPMTMYVNDFDRNGTVEQIINCYNDETSYPMQLRHDLVMQMPSLKKKYLKYESFKNETINNIFTKEQLEGSIIYEATTLESMVFINDGKGSFTAEALPIEAQFSPIYAIDISEEAGQIQIALGGNFFAAKPDVGRYDASKGLIITPNEQEPSNWWRKPMNINGQIRQIVRLQNGRYVIARNNDAALIFDQQRRDY